MANVENALRELLDVVNHLVHTNVRWNMDMDHATAVAKVETARAHLATGDAVKAVDDASNVVADLKSGDAVSAVSDGKAVVGDAVDLVKDVKSMGDTNA